MPTEEVKRGRGRPRKDQGKPANPDCEPASKGYVKCMMRKMAIHTHEQKTDPIVTFFAFGICLTAAFFIYIYSVSIPELAWYSLVTMGIVFAVVWCEFMHDYENHTGSSSLENSEAFEKYIPPEEIQRVCEIFNKKKECEE